MQVLYVTNFDVTARRQSVTVGAKTTGTSDVADVCLELMGRWAGGHPDNAIPPVRLREDGEVELAPSHDNQRFARWEHLAGIDSWATRLERRDLRADGSQFVTRVTVGTTADRATVRVSMAREGAAGLTPADAPQLLQPGIVATLVEDSRLEVRVDGQIQHGRYVQVRSPEETELLAHALRQRPRLPLLLLHTRTLEAQAAAARAAARLLGLVRVVTVDYRAARQLRILEPGADVPYAGGLLVWADLSAPPIQIPPDQLNQPDRELLRSMLMARIAPLSVLTRGTDTAFRLARQAANAFSAAQAAQATAAAASSGTPEQQLAALAEERDQAKRSAAYAETEWLRAEQLAEEQAEKMAALTAQVEQLTIAARYWPTPSAVDTTEDETLDNAPDLQTTDTSSLDRLCQHLERAVEGRIVFTPNAKTAWQRADHYPTPQDMRDALVGLTRIARDLYDGQKRSIGHLDTWIWENYSLHASLQDDKMPRKFRTFDWEGRTYDRVPHVKVNDGVPPAECGRIYFAFDHINQQLIVDHVGLHW